MKRQDIFEKVRKAVDIRRYIEAATGVRAKRVGEGSWRIIPCPFCHSDSGFTINEQEQYFKCFSGCSEKGDVIHFEEIHGRHENAYEAAKAIAEKEGISLDGRPVTKPAKKSAPPPSSDPGPTDETPSIAIEEARASAVRKIAAEFYHQRLLANPEALKYQTETRKHSLEAIKRFKIGLGGGNLKTYCEERGVSMEELLAVGLVGQRGKGIGAWIANGYWTYPHMVDGRCLYISMKPGTKEGRKYQVRKQYVGNDWFCYGQENLEGSEPLIIVEGENDLISIVDKGKYPHVIATLGAYNESNILKAVKARARGREFYLCFDHDVRPDDKEPAGARYTRKYANAILAGGGKVRVIEIPLGPDGQGRDIDDVLRESRDPEAELRRLMDRAREIMQKTPDREDGRRLPPRPDSAYEFDTFDVLGELADDRIIFWSNINQKNYRVDPKNFPLEILVLIGGEPVARHVARGPSSARDGQIVWGELRKRLIVKAGKTQLGTPECLGQGIHFLQKGQLLVNNGAGTWLWDGKRLEQYKGAVIEGNLLDRKKGHDWVNFTEVQRLLRDMNLKGAQGILDELCQWFFQWQFVGRRDPWPVVGWVLAQYIQMIWSWRPHMWVTGQSGSGKTLLQQLVSTLGGELSLPCEGQTLTEPGLRQSIGSHSCLVQIDEMEPGPHREAILKFIRSAGRGVGKTRKGSAGQKPITARFNHMVLLSSIEMGIGKEAEVGRYLRVETRKDTTGKVHPRVFGAHSPKAEELRAKAVAYALWAAFGARKIAEENATLQRGGYDIRFAESVLVPASMIGVAAPSPEERTNELVNDYLEEYVSREGGLEPTDQEQLWTAVLSARIRVPQREEGELRPDGTYSKEGIVYLEPTVGQLIEDREELTRAQVRAMEACGIKLTDRGVFLYPTSIEETLLKGTRWRHMGIRDVLKRLEGVEYGRSLEKQRLAGAMPVRGISVPWTYFLKDEEEPPEPGGEPDCFFFVLSPNPVFCPGF